MKKVFVLTILLVLFVLGVLVGLNIKQNEIGRYQLQNMFSGAGTLSNTIPKALLDTKTGEVWILIIKDGYEWKQIRTNNNENKTSKDLAF